jgi:hypothetical protein
MTPFEELDKTGTIGTATYRLLIQKTSQVGRKYNFPPPDGFNSWTHEATTEWLSDVFFMRKDAFDLPKRLQLTSTDEVSLEKQLWATIRNAMRDVAKSTVPAKLGERLAGLLGKDDRFQNATKATYAGEKSWTLASNGAEIFTGDWEELLVDPAFSKLPLLEPLNSSGPTSKHNRAVITDAAAILLERAVGALEQIVIAKALVELFDLEEADVFALRDTDLPTESDYGIPGREIEVSELAISLVDLLAHADVALYGTFPDEQIDNVRDLVRSQIPSSTLGEDLDRVTEAVLDECQRRAAA